jgi:His-Xaa-Ser system protein HxsD
MRESEKDLAATASLTFDSQVYSLTAVKKAAYRYLDRFSAAISIDDKHITCILTLTTPLDPAACARLLEDFRKEVLDQDLREVLKVETEAIRNLILAYAFSQTAMPSDDKIS